MADPELNRDEGGWIPPGLVLVTFDVAECVARAQDVASPNGPWVCCRTDEAHLNAAHRRGPDFEENR